MESPSCKATHRCLKRWTHAWESRERYRAIMEACEEGIICLDTQGRILACNPSAERILQLNALEMKHRSCVEGIFEAIDESGRSIPPHEHPSQIVLNTGRPYLNAIQGLRKADGGITWICVNAQPLFAPHSKSLQGDALRGVVVSFSDITQSKELEFRLRTEAYRDVMTGAYNRRYFQEVLHRALKSVERFGYPVAVAMGDLDHFKAINDTFGHASGDRAIQAFSETLHWGMRQNDLSARLGGDEFCVLFQHVNAQSAVTFLERARKQLESQLVPAEDGRPMQLRASFGLADYAPGDTCERLMDKADLALYRAKAQGGNQICVLG